MSFELAGGPYAVTAARLALADLDSHLDTSVAFDVRLLVSELVTNSVQHAQVAAEDSIVLAVSFSDATVRVEVHDDGPGFEPPVSPPPDDADAGWGLFLVEQLADAWGVGEDGTGVWFEITRNRSQEGGEAPSSESTAAQVGRRGRKRAKGEGDGEAGPVATTDYEDTEGNVLTLRDSLSAGTLRKLSEGAGGAASTRDDQWQRQGELMFERLAVSWTISGLPLTGQKELLGRYRMADADTRRWVRERLEEHFRALSGG